MGSVCHNLRLTHSAGSKSSVGSHTVSGRIDLCIWCFHSKSLGFLAWPVVLVIHKPIPTFHFGCWLLARHYFLITSSQCPTASYSYLQSWETKSFMALGEELKRSNLPTDPPGFTGYSLSSDTALTWNDSHSVIHHSNSWRKYVQI